MSLEFICLSISIVALAAMCLMLEKRVQRLEKLLSQTARSAEHDGQ